MRKVLTVEERREFYARVSEQLDALVKRDGLQPDVDADDDDYDGGRYDFYTTRGVK